MKKQTAVEWLIEQWPILESQLPPQLINEAKAIEREQIQSAYKDGLIWRPNDFLGQQQYYDEIYGDDK